MPTLSRGTSDLAEAEIVNVAAMRHELAMTQQQLGDALGVNRRTIDRWEHGGSLHPVWRERLILLWQEIRPREPLPTETE